MIDDKTLQFIGRSQLYVSIRKIQKMAQDKNDTMVKLVVGYSMLAVKLDRQFLPFINDQLPKEKQIKIKHINTNKLSDELVESFKKINDRTIGQIFKEGK